MPGESAGNRYFARKECALTRRTGVGTCGHLVHRNTLRSLRRQGPFVKLDQTASFTVTLLEFVDFAEFALQVLQVRFRIQALPRGSFEQIQRFVLRSVTVDVLLQPRK